MSRTAEIPFLLTIPWLRRNYGERQITPEQVIQTIIERAENDTAKNIWVTRPDLSFIQPYLDQLKDLPLESHPLWGIPFAIKDNIDLAGVKTTAGCPDFAYLPSEHATVVGNLIRAGAIPVGKANLDQFATGLVGTRSPYGEVHNALKDELISGGSSAGSAVAVARGQAAFALGTDTAGSGRVPAALNHLIGFKSSIGAWSTRGLVPACASLDCITVFAHSVAEAETVDRSARSYDPECAWSRSIPEPASRQPKKILLPRQALHFFGPFKDEYEAAWHTSMQMIQQLGLPIERIDNTFFTNIARLLYDGPFVAERWADLGPFVEAHPGSSFPVTEKILRSGAKPAYTASLLFDNLHQLAAAKQKVKALLQNAVFITPTAGGTWTRAQVDADPVRTNSEMGEYTNHCNLLDLCAISVPAFDADDHLPFGVTVFASADHEDYLLGMAAQIEQSVSETEFQETADAAGKETVQIAVCGLHMRGFALESQLQTHRAHFVRESATAEKYSLYRLNTQPEKPGLVKSGTGGRSIQLELWTIPLSELGSFATSIPSPLGIGKVELNDGREVPGFICEPYGAKAGTDISEFGGWRSYVRTMEK
ncbi:allophanate hydrolase [Sporolactobacillus vineae]|uniref:allophanate hydrolase n=1 Tax=Sporolactobacillus vineae TaxID=444463 RepID=UPI000289AB40|nr:allophanate hydrolase [Sporolactobacillus vineae]